MYMALGSSGKNLKKIMKEQLTFGNGLQNFSSVPWSCCSPIYIPQRNHIHVLKLLTLPPVILVRMKHQLLAVVPPIFYSWGQEAMIWNQQCYLFSNLMILIDHEDVERSFNFFLPVLGNSGATTCSLLFQRRNSFYFQKSLLTLKREPSGNGIYI